MTLSLIYMDNHATTRVDPRVVDAMLPFLDRDYGLPYGPPHALNQRATQAVEASRAKVASLLGADRNEIYFTSGATESNNWALKSVAAGGKSKGRHVVSVATEHPSVLAPLRRLMRDGWEVTLLVPRSSLRDDAGCIDVEELVAALRKETVLVSVMFANNEIGAIQPLRLIGNLCQERGILFHCDATQAVGRIPVALRECGVDLASFSAHKFYGPKGVGGMFVRAGTVASHAISQYRELQGYPAQHDPCTHVAGIVALARALELAVVELHAESHRVQGLRDALYAGLRAAVSGLVLNGPQLHLRDHRLPGNLNVRIDGVDGEALMLAVPELAISSGSACSSQRVESSHVLRALGLSDTEARTSLRFGLGRFTTPSEVATVVDRVTHAVRRLRLLSPRHHC